MPYTPNISKKSSSKGELLTVRDVATKAEISEATVKRILQVVDNVDVVKISGTRFIYYRDFLRAAWEYESSKERPGRKYANSHYEN